MKLNQSKSVVFSLLVVPLLISCGVTSNTKKEESYTQKSFEEMVFHPMQLKRMQAEEQNLQLAIPVDEPKSAPLPVVRIDEIPFADSDLRDCVLKEATWYTPDAVYSDQIDSLFCGWSPGMDYHDIDNISGIEYLSNLSWLTIGTIQDQGGEINLDPLRRLKKLRGIIVSGPRIRDISALGELRRLEIFGLEDAPIESLEPLTQTSLASLILYPTRSHQIDLYPLRNISTLRHASVDLGNGYETHDYLGQVLYLTNINELYIFTSDSWSSLAGRLDHATHLEYLYLGSEFQMSIADLQHLTNLKGLYFGSSSYHIENLSGIENLTNLEALSIPYARISDLSPLQNLQKLQYLWLDHNRITDLAPLAGLTALKQLGLEENQIVSLTPLAGLVNLTSLFIDFNRVTDISAVQDLISLSFFSAGENDIRDIRALFGLSNLYFIGLYGNHNIPCYQLDTLRTMYNYDPWEENPAVDLSLPNECSDIPPPDRDVDGDETEKPKVTIY